MKIILHILLFSLSASLALALYDGSNDVQVFENNSDFKKRIIEGDSISLVQFYAPWCGHCKQFVPAYTQIATLLKGIANVAAVDAASDGPQKRIAGDYGVTGFPTMKLFYDGKMDDVQTRDPNELIKTILDTMQTVIQSRADGQGNSSSSSSSSSSGNKKVDSKVVELTDSNFDDMVNNNSDVIAVAFVAPWCGHCKSLLPEWDQASALLDGSGATLGIVDATKNERLANRFKVEGYPTIKMFPGGKGKKEAMEYLGGRTAQQIVDHVLKEVDLTGAPKEIPELLSADHLDETCGDKLCVLVALPHILETGAEGRNKYKDIMTAASKAVRGMAFQFMWFEGGSEQPALENALELTFGFPAVAAYSIKKGVFGVHRSSFTETNIRKFLLGITSGGVRTMKIDQVPKINTVEPWDGKDGVPFEEEDLADIMGWDDDEDEL